MIPQISKYSFFYTLLFSSLLSLAEDNSPLNFIQLVREEIEVESHKTVLRVETISLAKAGYEKLSKRIIKIKIHSHRGEWINSANFDIRNLPYWENQFPMTFKPVIEEKIKELFSIAEEVLTHPIYKGKDKGNPEFTFDILLDTSESLNETTQYEILKFHGIDSIQSYLSIREKEIRWLNPTTTKVLQIYSSQHAP